MSRALHRGVGAARRALPRALRTIVRCAGPLVGAVLAVGCDGAGAPGGSPAAPSSSAAAAPLPSISAPALDALREAEQRRLARSVPEDASRDRDPIVRRAAARALARIGGAEVIPPLRRALADEDPEVVAWAAYGLGFACEHAREATTSALVARAVALSGPSAEDPRSFEAIARAVGRCAAPASEATLAAWLASPGPGARAAALALGDLASSQKRLREETLASLLALAQGTVAQKPAAEALVPIGRLENVPPSVRDRLLEVGQARLADAGPYRLHVVKALGRAGEGAAQPLRRVLDGAGTFSPSERSEAVRALGRLGKVGQAELEEAVLALAQGATAASVSAIEPSSSVLPLAIGALERSGDATPALRALAALAPPEGAKAPALRRLAHVRCAAARVLAGDDPTSSALGACDPTGGGVGERALVAVLGRATIEKDRRAIWQRLLGAKEARTREAALELLASHPEIEDAATPLAAALAAPELGVVGTAAELVAKHPHLALDPAAARKRARDAKKKGKDGAPPPEEDAAVRKLGGPVDARIGEALAAALPRAIAADDPEVLGALADALGAIARKEAAPALAPLCQHAAPDVRRRAAAALSALEGKARACALPESGAPRPAELDAIPSGPRTIVLETDVGELSLSLDPALAPVTVARLVALVSKGYFDGKTVHRVVPGFVAQLGAPHADGWGGAPDVSSLRCETSPVPFDANVVGMALAGRDTGSTQLFVTFARHPHLDGNYATVGTAEGAWESLVEGDEIQRARLSP